MSFWKFFCLYFVGTLIAIGAGWLVIQLLIYLIDIVTRKAGARSIRRRRSDVKEERIEDEEEST